jgi:hypothetical protein
MVVQPEERLEEYSDGVTMPTRPKFRLSLPAPSRSFVVVFVDGYVKELLAGGPGDATDALAVAAGANRGVAASASPK